MTIYPNPHMAWRLQHGDCLDPRAAVIFRVGTNCPPFFRPLVGITSWTIYLHFGCERAVRVTKKAKDKWTRATKTNTTRNWRRSKLLSRKLPQTNGSSLQLPPWTRNSITFSAQISEFRHFQILTKNPLPTVKYPMDWHASKPHYHHQARSV